MERHHGGNLVVSPWDADYEERLKDRDLCPFFWTKWHLKKHAQKIAWEWLCKGTCKELFALKVEKGKGRKKQQEQIE